MTARNFIFMFLAIVAIILAVSSQVKADFDVELFTTQVRTSPITCHDLDSCRSQGLEIVVLHSPVLTSPSVAHLLPKLTVISEDQASIWSDTILEGGYDADGNTKLDRIEGIYNGSILVSYRITYSEKAWILGDNGEKSREGRIVESSFVSSTLRSWLRDDKSLATFN